MNLVTIKTFDNSIDANMLRCQLELEGIHSYLKNENTIATNPMYNVTLGGIKLQVFDVSPTIKRYINVKCVIQNSNKK